MAKLENLLEKKTNIMAEMMNLKEMRRGSVVEQFYELKRKDGSIVRRGPYYLYSYKEKGKTISRRLSGLAEAEQVREQIEQFRRFEQLTSEFVSVNHAICEAKLRTEGIVESSGKKKRLS